MTDGRRKLAGQDELEVFRKITATFYAEMFSDILDAMGIRDQVFPPDLGIRPLIPTSVMIGRALTFLNDLDPHGTEPYQKAVEGLDQLQPGQILVATTKTPTDAGIMGRLSAGRIIKRGGMGALIDGYTRDARRLVNMGFPCFVRGASPLDAAGRARVIDFNVPITVGGKRIEPGQIIFADANGIVLIPPDAEEEIFERALERAEVEARLREELY